MDFPSIDVYSTRGQNGTVLTFPLPSGSVLKIWYSYRTPVAFALNGAERIVRVNDWNRTTGGHLADIDGGGATAKRLRLPGKVFEEALAGALGALEGGA